MMEELRKKGITFTFSQNGRHGKSAFPGTASSSACTTGVPLVRGERERWWLATAARRGRLGYKQHLTLLTKKEESMPADESIWLPLT